MADGGVLVVGAGPTGLVLALCLARRGVAVRIIDKAAGPGTASRATIVHARTLEFYQQLGFAEAVVERGIKVERFHLREGGNEVAQLVFGDLGEGLSPFPFVLCFPQDDHERFLIERLGEAGVQVEWNTTLIRFTQDDTGICAVLDANGTGQEHRAAYLCGCDGGRSRVRQDLQLGFPGGTYDQLFYVADVAADTENRDLVVSLGDSSLALMLPVRSSGTQRLIGLVPAGFSGGAKPDFADVQPEAERLLGVRVTGVNWYSTYHVHHRVAAQFRVGRCFISGDAGHVHSPAGGQGMNTGIGDAINLGWKLAQVLQGRIGAGVLDSYESERIAFARQLVTTSDRAFQGMVGQGAANQILRTWLMPHLFPFLTGFSAVRRAMFRAVSQTRINYHGSALSAGKAGHVEGGDRLPWVADNYRPLQSLDWQLHVYGVVSPALAAEADLAGLPVHRFAWTEEADTAGLRQDAAYLVRPDGYVALAMEQQEPAALRAFVARLGLKSVEPA